MVRASNSSFGGKIATFAEKTLDVRARICHHSAHVTTTCPSPPQICGTLDILFAVLLTLWRGRAPADMLRFVASGPFPSATDMGTAGSVLGLVVHFTLMAMMVAAFLFAARNYPIVLDQPLLSGLIFALVTYVAMNLVVVPLRFPRPGRPPRSA